LGGITYLGAVIILELLGQSQYTVSLLASYIR